MIRCVNELLPKQSFRMCVSFESRNGTCWKVGACGLRSYREIRRVVACFYMSLNVIGKDAPPLFTI